MTSGEDSRRQLLHPSLRPDPRNLGGDQSQRGTLQAALSGLSHDLREDEVPRDYLARGIVTPGLHLALDEIFKLWG